MFLITKKSAVIFTGPYDPPDFFNSSQTTVTRNSECQKPGDAEWDRGDSQRDRGIILIGMAVILPLGTLETRVWQRWLPRFLFVNECFLMEAN